MLNAGASPSDERLPNVHGVSMFMCPAFRTDSGDAVFFRNPDGGPLSMTDAYDTCGCNPGNNAGQCTQGQLTRNQCSWDGLIAQGNPGLVVENCVDVAIEDNPWLDRSQARFKFCQVLDCGPDREPTWSFGQCSCGSPGSGMPLPATWDICTRASYAVCGIPGEPCICR